MIKMTDTKQNTYCPENDEYDITTDEDMLRWRAYEITEKPCHILQYCPYGDAIHCTMPVPEHFDKSLCDNRTTDGYRHHCPVFYIAEPGEDMGFAGQGIAENILESMGCTIEKRAPELPPRVI